MYRIAEYTADMSMGKCNRKCEQQRGRALRLFPARRACGPAGPQGGDSYIFGLGGGNSRATTWSLKPIRLWLPSQKGLLAEWPQRQREMTVLPARPKSAPLGSRISNSPSMRIGPLWLQVTLAGI